MVWGLIKSLGKRAFNFARNIAKNPSVIAKHLGKAIDVSNKIGSVADTVGRVAEAAQTHVNPDSKIGKLLATAGNVAGKVSQTSGKFSQGAGKAGEFLHGISGRD